MHPKRIPFICAALTLFTFSLFTNASAQETVKHRYEVSSTTNGSKVATVETLANKEIVSVAVIRAGEPTHHYRAYLSVRVTDASIGGQSLFSIYHNEETIKAGGFNHKFSEVSGPERKGHAALEPVRRQLADDMRVLRAVSGFDPNSCVLLAELDYVIVTYDSSIFEGAPSDLLRVTEGDGAMARQNSPDRLKVVRTRLNSAPRQNDSLDGCLDGADARFIQCRGDQAVADKTTCYNNRSTEVQQCYSIYGAKKPAPVESQS
jgi:hypothetical protein